MTTESLPYLELLGDFIVRLSNELSNSTGPWDRHATRLMLSLYDLLTDGHNSISDFFVNLKTFQEQDEVEVGRTLLREFAISHIKVEDFFSEIHTGLDS